MNDHIASTTLDPVISRYLAHRRALGRQYDMQERTLHSLTDFLVQVGESDLSSPLFDSWCKTFDSLTSNVRRARQVVLREPGGATPPGYSPAVLHAQPEGQLQGWHAHREVAAAP
jgi:hypothetical protein